jgi:putative ABC transport system substrate-binding protein
MNRRTIIAALGGAAAWPLAARGQQSGKLPTIGFLGPASASAMSSWTAAFVQRLRELGWIEGRTAIEYRWAEGRSERFPEVAAEFIGLKVDVIVTTGSAVPAFKQATSVIPIVFAIANDPIGSGLVESFSRPGGNVTGLSILAADLGGKRLEILREVIPGLSRLATLGDATNFVTASEMAQVQEAARTLGLEIVRSEIRRAEDIAPAIEAFKGRADALYVQSAPLMNTNRTRISILALGARLPTLSGIRDYVEAEVLCPMDQTSQTSSGAPATMSIRFCAGRSPPTCPFSSRPGSISL